LITAPGNLEIGNAMKNATFQLATMMEETVECHHHPLQLGKLFVAHVKVSSHIGQYSTSPFNFVMVYSMSNKGATLLGCYGYIYTAS
jgi:hypothetical protein